jgi:hypothetical protein
MCIDKSLQRSKNKKKPVEQELTMFINLNLRGLTFKNRASYV